MKTLDVLVKAKEIIQEPANWIQGDYSNDERTCFCSLGAIAQVMGVDEMISAYQPASKLLLEVVSSEIPAGRNFAAYNDEHTHAEVMEAFDKAIELAKSETE